MQPRVEDGAAATLLRALLHAPRLRALHAGQLNMGGSAAECVAELLEGPGCPLRFVDLRGNPPHSPEVAEHSVHWRIAGRD